MRCSRRGEWIQLGLAWGSSLVTSTRARRSGYHPIAGIGFCIHTEPMEESTAFLIMGDGLQIEVSDVSQLNALLEPMNKLLDGEAVTLRRTASDFIKATRHGQFWSVTVKRGSMWTAQSFTAEMTTEYTERRAREGRGHGSLRSRFMWWLRSPSPERALACNQVRTLLSEYLAGKRFTLPKSGA